MVGQTDLSTIGASKPSHCHIDGVCWNGHCHRDHSLDLGDVLGRHCYVESILNRSDDSRLGLKEGSCFLPLSVCCKTHLHVEMVLGAHLESTLHNFGSRCHGGVDVPVLPGRGQHGRNVERVLHPLLDVDHHRAQALVLNLHLTRCGQSYLPECDSSDKTGSLYIFICSC